MRIIVHANEVKSLGRYMNYVWYFWAARRSSRCIYALINLNNYYDLKTCCQLKSNQQMEKKKEKYILLHNFELET